MLLTEDKPKTESYKKANNNGVKKDTLGKDMAISVSDKKENSW